ncbi:MAG TPA: hypothetical protein VFS19_01270 [Planctomycetota bacterium]|nr:hypothetical protein [Planctomycetota bacterium]
MIAIFLLALLQEQPVEASIAAFLKGDAAARGELMKLGVFAIRPLQKARDKNPEKVDALVLELKKGTVYPASSKMYRELEDKVTIPESTVTLSDDPEELSVRLGDARSGIPAPVLVQRFRRSDVKSMTATIRATDRPAREVLDQLCRQTGLDYAVYHNAVILGPPDRLWPAGPPAKPRPLTTEEETRLKGWIEKLKADDIAAREEATREILKFGVNALPVLEKLPNRPEALIQALGRKPAPPFGPAFATGQALDPVDAATLKALENANYPTLRLVDVPLNSLLEIILGGKDIEFEMKSAAAGESVIASLDASLIGGLDVLSLLTQMTGADFAISGGKVIVDTRERLERAYPKAK